MSLNCISKSDIETEIKIEDSQWLRVDNGLDNNRDSKISSNWLEKPCASEINVKIEDSECLHQDNLPGNTKDSKDDLNEMKHGCESEIEVKKEYHKRLRLDNGSGYNENFDYLSREESTENSDVHVIFMIDMSGSMQLCDAKVSKTIDGPMEISRWDAVFECAKEFVDDQVKAMEEEKSRYKMRGGSDAKSSKTLFSLILWSIEAKLSFDRIELTGNGENVKKELIRAKNKNQPRGQGIFAKAFKRARELIDVKEYGCSERNVLIFLSDGRPSDLKREPPGKNKSHPNEAMQRSYRYHGQTYDSVAVEIEKLIRTVNNKRKSSDYDKVKDGALQINFLGIYDEGYPWLKYLAKIYSGKFYEARLEVEADSDVKVVWPADRYPIPGSMNPPTTTSSFQTANEIKHPNKRQKIKNEVKQEFDDPSYCMPLMPNYVENSNNGQHVSIKKESKLSTGLRSAFVSISAATTSLRTCNSGKASVEKIVELENENEDWTSMTSHLFTDVVVMEMIADSNKFKEKSNNSKTIRIRKKPFAQGGLRNVYKMLEFNILSTCVATEKVAKESRHEVPYSERLKFHIEATKCQKRAQELAEQFNIVASTVNLEAVEFIQTEVYRIRDSSSPGNFRYVSVEPFLKGKYLKFNGNNGYVCSEPSDRIDFEICELSQAFSHWTHCRTNGEEIVVDMQGAGFRYTDPQINSIAGNYGRADRKKKGIDEFFESHICRLSCNILGISELI